MLKRGGVGLQDESIWAYLSGDQGRRRDAASIIKTVPGTVSERGPTGSMTSIGTL